jgi:hypothetical protein
MAAVGRRLGRTVLVDDTPLAFLHQPANGVPVLGFRGDPDDRLLGEAVLPLLRTLAAAPDVRPLLERRFDMGSWFLRHGYPASIWVPKPAPAAAVIAEAAAAAAQAPVAAAAAAAMARAAVKPMAAAQPARPAAPAMPRGPIAAAQALRLRLQRQHSRAAAPAAPAAPQQRPRKEVLFLTDFDKTLTAWDAGERLVGELAPELAPMLAALQMPANFVPVTNDVMSEMARRGVSRDAILAALTKMGAELPAASVRLLRSAAARGVDVKVLSDCNSVFIDHVLAGARLRGCVEEVITNDAAFERVATAADDAAGVGLGAATAAAAPPARSCGHRLVVLPRRTAPAACPLCPANLCKGEEVAGLKAAGVYRRIVDAGDGETDIHPALELAEGDVVLPRAGHALHRYCLAAAAGEAAPPRAEWHAWASHDELAALVEKFTVNGGAAMAN